MPRGPSAYSEIYTSRSVAQSHGFVSIRLVIAHARPAAHPRSRAGRGTKAEPGPVGKQTGTGPEQASTKRIQLCRNHMAKTWRRAVG